jgi:NAD(P)H-hydrate epimerase
MTLINPDAVARIDAECIASGMSGYRLMTAAGHAVAAAVLRHYPDAIHFVVLAGPGNNGGDGYVAAGALEGSGATVEIYRLISAPPATEDARRAAADCALAPRPLAAYAPTPGDVIIDGVFGAGLVRDLPPDLVAKIAAIEAAGLPVIAIDMPSGVCGRTGRILGGAFHATHTITFVARKTGQVLMPGRDNCGAIEIADIGVPARITERHASSTVINSPAIWTGLERRRTSASHKYAHGALVVFSGGGTQTGAARLAAEAGLKAGAGLVTVAAPRDALAVNAAHLTAVMLRAVDDREALERMLADRRLSAFVLGPGFGVGSAARDYALALAGRNLVLDADGITAFADTPDILFSAFAQGEPHLVLTPHDGEFVRLFPDLARDTALSKVEKALAAARRAHAAVIYKGADTVIAAPDGRSAINENAPPWLATAGSGDVLAGLCGAHLARGLPVFEAACAAVWRHGDAAFRAGRGLTAETLINFIDA